MSGKHSTLPPQRRFLQRLAVRHASAMVFLRIEEVDWLETAGNYVRVHARGTEYRLREALVRLEEQLDPDQFVRISRSAIVNLDRVARLFPGLDGDLVIELSNGVRLPLLAKYRSRVCDQAGRF